MALSSTDERDLLLPLHEGIRETPVWDTFLRRLLARTTAQQVCLLLRPAASTANQSIVRRATAIAGVPEPDFDRLEDTGLIPLSTMRPERVYSLHETISPLEDDLRLRQREVLADARIAEARMVRIRTKSANEAWLVITHQRRDFGAGDSVLLSALTAHIAIALDTLVALDSLRLRAAMAEDALALLGIRQGALDREGRLVQCDTDARAGRLPIAPRVAQELAEACAAIAKGAQNERRVVRTGMEDGADLLLRPAPETGCALPGSASVLALARTQRRETTPHTARVIAATLGLSATEAALADALSRGRPLVEAGSALRLTPETARNYSKRIYAKTGATGQADLVRMVLSGLAPLA